MPTAVPSTPFTDAGGTIAECNGPPPQQTTAPLAARIAQVWSSPAAIATAPPPDASIEAGGGAWPNVLSPQHTTLPVPDWIAHACSEPDVIAAAVPEVPSTEAGGPSMAPQQTTPPVAEWIAQLK